MQRQPVWGPREVAAARLRAWLTYPVGSDGLLEGKAGAVRTVAAEEAQGGLAVAAALFAMKVAREAEVEARLLTPRLALKAARSPLAAAVKQGWQAPMARPQSLGARLQNRSQRGWLARSPRVCTLHPRAAAQ